MKNWQPRDVIAGILASTILVLVLGSVIARFMGSPEISNPDLIGAWRDLMLTLLGALAGYIGGSTKSD